MSTPSIDHVGDDDLDLAEQIAVDVSITASTTSGSATSICGRSGTAAAGRSATDTMFDLHEQQPVDRQLQHVGRD